MNRKLSLSSVTRLGLLAGLLVTVGAGPATEPGSPQPAAAVPPATQPGGGPLVRRTVAGNHLVRVRDIAGLADRVPPWMGDNPTTEPSETEWKDISDFAAENFPNRWKLFQTLETQKGDENKLVMSLKDRITTRYRTLRQVQRLSPDLYDAAIKQGQLEDDAWGATVAARKKQLKNVDLNAKMQEKVAALVKNMLQERQDRLDQMAASIKTEQEKLDSDKDNVDALISKQIERLSGDAPYDSNLPNRGFGGGPGGGGRRFDNNEASAYQGPGGGGPGGGPGGGRRNRMQQGPATRPD